MWSAPLRNVSPTPHLELLDHNKLSEIRQYTANELFKTRAKTQTLYKEFE
jgi:hypothetical protein